MYQSIISAFLLGLATIISPCPFCSDITAVSYISRDVSSRRRVIGNGIFYGLGKLTAYFGLSLLFLFGVQIAPIQAFLERYGEPALGPFFVVCAIVMAIMGYREGHHQHQHNHNHLSRVKGGAFILGFCGSLAFCPYSGVLYFGIMIPLAISQPLATGWLVPLSFGIATALPVLAIAIVIAYGIGSITRLQKHLSRVEVILRWFCVTLFLAMGIYMCVSIFGGHHHHHDHHDHITSVNQGTVPFCKMISELHGQTTKKSDTIFRFRNGKQQSYQKSDNEFIQTPARERNQNLMSDASRITKEIMSNPELLRPYECRFKCYDPSANNGKRFENLRGFVFSQVFAELKSQEG